MADDRMQQAIHRALAGEPVNKVAHELGLPESSLRWNIKKLRRPVPLGGTPGGSQGGSQLASQAKTPSLDLDPRGWLQDARIIQAWLMKAISGKLQAEGLKLRDLVVTFGIITDKIHQAEALLRPVAEATALAQTTVIIKVQQGNKIMSLDEFVGDPPEAVEHRDVLESLSQRNGE